MTEREMLDYLLKNEAARYAAEKEGHKTWRYVLMSIIASITIIVCFYMYFVVPVEEYVVKADKGSTAISDSAVIESMINGGNNGSEN